jgi:aldose 1-epimerase
MALRGESRVMPAIHLQSGLAQLVLRPDLGASIESLQLGDVAIMHCGATAQGGALTHAKDSASYPLLPYSNRLAHAQLVWAGQHYALAPNFAPEVHAIHGVAWRRAWAVAEQGAAHARCTLSHMADEDWPFAFEAWQSFALTDKRLIMTIGMTNRAATPAPAGMGWHPFFTKRAGSHISFAAAGRWEMDAAKLPSTFSASGGLDRSCAGLEVDHCFDGWRGLVTLRDERMHLQLHSDFSRLVVYTTPGHPSIAIEPVSHVNNAMNEPNAETQGVRILLPGESWVGTMTLDMQAL